MSLSISEPTGTIKASEWSQSVHLRTYTNTASSQEPSRTGTPSPQTSFKKTVMAHLMWLDEVCVLAAPIHLYYMFLTNCTKWHNLGVMLPSFAEYYRRCRCSRSICVGRSSPPRFGSPFTSLLNYQKYTVHWMQDPWAWHIDPEKVRSKVNIWPWPSIQILSKFCPIFTKNNLWQSRYFDRFLGHTKSHN